MEFIKKHFNELSLNELYEILKTRSEIFVVEQDCVYQDLDDNDQNATHIFSMDEKGRVTSCLRVFVRDETSSVIQIGRVVTLVHGTGLGGRLLHEGVETAVNDYHAKKIYLEAQQYAKGYYAKEGFEVVSEPFLEDGIPHVKMEKVIS
ncbi:MAG: GNAT family N-acetyltransferase [Butyrivibrio sp.]|nr:GNAT family N-acetyltransferase [Butyrivibrio sp.]